jgi:16S rRNA (cytidine1402-2'-O)-methyltransferase
MSVLYLIPSLLEEEGLQAIPLHTLTIIKECQVFFVENERTTRRYLKKLWKHFMPGAEITIDNYEWFTISDDAVLISHFRKKVSEGKTIGLFSEAGCPGVADPGQQLISIAQELNIEVKPLTGPSSILLALMASGMNGQQFQFVGYLPIENQERSRAIKELEASSQKNNSTQIFIETPYRNNQLTEALLKQCRPGTKLCIAVDLTGSGEWVKTKTIAEWQKNKPDLHKRPAIFLLHCTK